MTHDTAPSPNANAHPYIIELTGYLNELMKEPNVWVRRLHNLLGAIPDEMLINCIDKEPYALLTVFNLSDFITYARSIKNPNVTDYILTIPAVGKDGSVNHISESQHILTLGLFADFIVHRDLIKANGRDDFPNDSTKMILAIVNAAFEKRLHLNS